MGRDFLSAQDMELISFTRDYHISHASTRVAATLDQDFRLEIVPHGAVDRPSGMVGAQACPFSGKLPATRRNLGRSPVETANIQEVT